jgi:hypothetical protein
MNIKCNRTPKSSPPDPATKINSSQEKSGMIQNKEEGCPELQHVMRTSQSLPQSVGYLLRMAKILRNNLPIAPLMYACSPSFISLFTS